MININIVRDNEGFIWEFTIRGHAGHGKSGSDIVCAAVSAVAYTAVGALETLAGLKCYSESNGYMKCSIPSDILQEKKYTVKIILEAMSIGFKQITFAYKKYVSFLDEEV